MSKLIQGNCLEGIKDIDDKSVKLIIADPPYFQGLTHNGKSASFSDLNISSEFFKLLFSEFKRVLRDDGFVFFFVIGEGTPFIILFLTIS